MNESLKFLFRAFLLTVGLILCLAALSNLVIYTNGPRYNDDSMVWFVLLSVIGIPTLLFGIRKLSV